MKKDPKPGSISKKAPRSQDDRVTSKDETYEDVTWYQQFFNEEGAQLHGFEFKIPPAAISIGDEVTFAFSNNKGKVTKVVHYFKDNLSPGDTGKPHLRHFIFVTVDTRDDDEEE